MLVVNCLCKTYFQIPCFPCAVATLHLVTLKLFKRKRITQENGLFDSRTTQSSASLSWWFGLTRPSSRVVYRGSEHATHIWFCRPSRTNPFSHGMHTDSSPIRTSSSPAPQPSATRSRRRGSMYNNIGGQHLRANLHCQESEAKAKFFFDVFCSFFDLFCLSFELFRFHSSFRLV